MKSHRKSLWLVFLLLLFGASAMAQEEVRVVVLPFDIHAPEALEGLRGQIRDLIEQQLQAEGVVVVKPKEPVEKFPGAKEVGLNRLRTLGLSAGADYVVWGSFTKIGKRFSLDTKVMESYGQAPRETVYVEGEGLETLLDAVQRLAKELGIIVAKREKVVRVDITGNKRIESAAIKRVMKTREGETYLAKNVQEDLKSIYRMGFFADVRAEASGVPEGKAVTFHVDENRTSRHVIINGNRMFDEEEIKELITFKSGAILNVNSLRGDQQQIENHYKEEGYHNVRVTFETKPVGENQADVVFEIEEGEKVAVKSITFEGNAAFDSDTLRGVMGTKEKGLLSWFTAAGDLDQEVLDQDVSRIAAYYHNHGYIEAKVAEPEVTYEGKWIYINFKIDEGSQFSVGKVDLEGDLILPKSELLEKMKMTEEDVYNSEVVRQDLLVLQDIYSDAGYAYAEISPRVDQDAEQLTADVTYSISKGPVVYFEKILITGNTKTRDKVIRRELAVYEQEPFSGAGLKQGTRNLYRLDYFEDIKVDTSKGSDDDKMVLKIDVTEKPTGAFSFGAGYSSMDKAFAMASISQRNLFGRGQTLNLRGQLGGTSSEYMLAFTEPWMFDIPLAAGFDVYNNSRDYNSYDKDAIGGTVRLGYTLFLYTRASVSYNYEKAKIKNLSDDASSSIREWEGTNTGHTATGIIRRDSRDRTFSPTEGSDNSISVKHAGTPFGGDIGFTKVILDSGWYFPLFWDLVGYLHGRTGYIFDDPVGDMPTWERFYLGGIDSVRGYDWRKISPTEAVYEVNEETGEKTKIGDDEIGGNKMVQFNVECLFPLVKDAGLMGVVFYDTGNAWDNGEDVDLSDLKKSAGCGLRWFSPMGPMRIEYGWILDSDRRGDGRWEFSMGAAF